MTTRSNDRVASNLRLLLALLLAATTALACGVEEGEGGGGAPVAAFTQDATGVAPGGAVQFTDTSSGNVTSWSWDFGIAGVSNEQHPLMTFVDPGDYTVRLTVSGPSGSSNTEKIELIHVGDLPTAGFSCRPTGAPEAPASLVGYAPFDITCTDASTGATSWSWDFGDGGSSTEQNPSHRFTTAAVYTVRQTVSNAVGSAEAETTATVHALDFTMELQPATGEVPTWVLFTAIDDAGLMESFRWYVDGADIGGGLTRSHLFLQPGSFNITLLGLKALDEPRFSGNVSQTLDIAFGPPLADFSADETGGFGPFEVQFSDESAGVNHQWQWTFGDGTSCAFPALPATPPAGMTLCNAAGPLHTYEDVGRYTVTLEVTGDSVADGTMTETDAETKARYITVYLKDPGFELQTAGAEISGAWESVPDSMTTPPVRHIALSRSVGGTDLGMPTDYDPSDPDVNGRLWAVVEGEDTDGGTPVATIDNGIRQTFLHDPARTVLEFDYVLLYAEPPASPVLDATVASVSDGVDTVEIPGSYADTDSPYAGPSLRYPTRDGSMVRGTPVHVASIDLAQAFPTATADTPFTLMIRTTNADNALRSPLVYVDDVRFAAVRAMPTADFAAGPGPFSTDEAVTFTDLTCADTDRACNAETSWRWDFDTHDLASAPAASGSAERSPSYVFDTRGDYDVTLSVRRGGAEDSHTETISIYEPVIAAFEQDPVPDPELPLPQAPVDLEFIDLSTSDVDDPITTWSWDFGGWGTSNAQDPGPISFLQAGMYTVTLEVTTSLGSTDTAQLVVEVE